MTLSQHEAFTHYAEHGPESRMELVSNRLLLGGDMRGSLAMLGYILAGWGADAALPLAAEEKWWAALRESFGGPEAEPSDLEAWREWVAGVEHQFALPELPQRPQLPVSKLRSDLSLAFHRTGLGTSLGRDFVMRLGEDAFTPDLIFISPRSTSVLYESHLDGPADIVVEICGPWNSGYVAGLKKGRYAEAGVGEYWLVYPEERQVEMLKLGPDGYTSQEVYVEGCYRPALEPRIGFYPAMLWSEEKGWWEQIIKISESDAGEAGDRLKAIRDDAWGSVPFAPRIELIPEPISFKEFLAWAPEAKFEWWDDRPQICGREGTRNTLGMLLMTFGLTEAVRLCHPREWVEALGRRREAIASDRRRKADWWEVAREAARVMRREFRFEMVGVIGDLVRTEPLNYWSEVSLVVRQVIPGDAWPRLWERLKEVGGELPIEVVEADGAHGWRRAAIADELVEI
jgi:Uma2 family endonuclease